jgi:hypothetical protein
MSVTGILTELRPLARMTVPRGLTSVLDLDIELGRPMVRTWLLLFGFLPVDRIDSTLIELHEGRGFIEESPTLSMRLWRHERSIDPVPGGSKITDRLTLEPYLAGPVVKWLISWLFRHRHRVLRRELGALR